MDLRRAFVFAACAACAREKGEPIGGDVTLTIDGAPIFPGFGAVIAAQAEPPKAMIVLGTRDINCGTSLLSSLRKGTYLTIVVDPAAGAQAGVTVSMLRADASGTLINGAAGDVVIDTFDARVTGNVMFETEDDVDGVITTLAASGTFDVANCL